MSTPESEIRKPVNASAGAESVALTSELIAVTDLGPNNQGSISCVGLTAEQRQVAIDRVASGECSRLPTNRWRCVDGRYPKGGLETAEGYSDPRIPGGIAIVETAADMMAVGHQHMPQSQLIAFNTRSAIEDGLQVVVHGDTHKGRAGCGANVMLRQTLRYNTDNLDVVKPKAWIIAQTLGLEQYLNEGDIFVLAANGQENAKSENLWDTSPEEAVEIAVENGADYEELIDEHAEKIVALDVSDNTIELEDAFVASLGAYKKRLFERELAKGKTQRQAALRMMSVILFTVGVSKQLTAGEEGSHEALPVVVIGNPKKSA